MTDHLALRPLYLGWDCVEPFDPCFWAHWSLLKSTMEKNPGMFSSKTLTSLRLKKERHEHLEWRGGEDIFILEVNFSFKIHLSFLEQWVFVPGQTKDLSCCIQPGSLLGMQLFSQKRMTSVCEVVAGFLYWCGFTGIAQLFTSVCLNEIKCTGPVGSYKDAWEYMQSMFCLL